VEVSQVSVQGDPKDARSWIDLARTIEQSGFGGLYVADHPGSGASPFVALAAAAGLTERIELGTYVVNAGVWEPMALAAEVATLDVVSGGRAMLGVGAGHTPTEWRSTGRAYPSPGERVDRMIELVDAVQALLSGGPVSRHGACFTLVDAVLVGTVPVQARLPLLIGGNGARVLAYGAATADRVGVTGLGRTLADGHRHEVDWSAAGLARTFETVHEAGVRAGRSPEVDALVQHVEITDDAEAAASRLVERIPGSTVADLLAAPFLWIGTAAEIAAGLDRHARDWGITRYTVRETVIAEVVSVFA